MPTQPQTIARELGKLEGEMTGVKESLARIEVALGKVETKLETLEADRNQRRGAMTLFGVLSGAVGAFIGLLATFVVKAWH